MTKKTELQSESRELLETVRQVVVDALEDGAKPPHLAAALAYVAAEMSLQLASSPAHAFPILLDAMATATKVHAVRIRDVDASSDPETISYSEETIH